MNEEEGIIRSMSEGEVAVPKQGWQYIKTCKSEGGEQCKFPWRIAHYKFEGCYEYREKTVKT